MNSGLSTIIDKPSTRRSRTPRRVQTQNRRSNPNLMNTLSISRKLNRNLNRSADSLSAMDCGGSTPLSVVFPEPPSAHESLDGRYSTRGSARRIPTRSKDRRQKDTFRTLSYKSLMRQGVPLAGTGTRISPTGSTIIGSSSGSLSGTVQRLPFHTWRLGTTKNDPSDRALTQMYSVSWTVRKLVRTTRSIRNSPLDPATEAQIRADRNAIPTTAQNTALFVSFFKMHAHRKSNIRNRKSSWNLELLWSLVLGHWLLRRCS